MNSLFDLSIMGHCGSDPTMVTGIPRAVIELGKHLQAEPDAHVRFCLTEEPGLAYGFARAHPAFTQSEFALLPNMRLWEFTLRRLESAYGRAQSKHYGLFPKIEAAILYRIKQRLPSIPLRSPAFADADIFHTPHVPISEELRQYKNLTFFQTIYDMIPFLMPDRFVSEQLDFYRRQLASLRPTDWIVTDSQSAKDDFCDIAKFDSSRVTVTHLAADGKKFQVCTDQEALRAVRNKYSIPPDCQYLLSVCTFEPRKNIEHVIRSFARLVRQESSTKELYLVLTGRKGWNFDDILQTIEGSTEIRSRLIVTGFVDDADLSPLYSGALAFLYMSLYEGFGLPPLEAMQCGTPVIVSNTSSLPEVVGDAGIQLSPQDTDALCQAILEVYSRPELRQEMGLKSRERAKKFTWQRCAQETIAAYKMALTVRQ